MQASDLSKKANKDFRDLYNQYPAAVEHLTDYPGEIGKLARLCADAGGRRE